MQLFQSQIQDPCIITGDFNSWNPIWGSSKYNKRGKIIETWLIESDMFLLNKKSPTHFTTHKSFTNIDLSICSSSLAPACSFEALKDLYGSDHFPLITNYNFSIKLKTHIPLFKTQLAHWPVYRIKVLEYLDQNIPSDNINKEAALLKKSIRYGACQSIPISKPFKTNNNPPWWNKNLNEINIKRKSSGCRLKKHPNQTNVNNYKKLNALFKRQIKIEKNDSFKKFTMNFNPQQTSSQIWNAVKRLSGIPNPTQITQIILNNNSITSDTDIGNTFGNYWTNEMTDITSPLNNTNNTSNFKNILPISEINNTQ